MTPRRKEFPKAAAPYTRDVTFRVKEVSESGEFAGHASVFDVVDWYRDVVKPGAFEKTLGEWKAEGCLPPVLWQHDSYTPVGPHTLMREDEKGLYVEGRLLIADVPQAKIAHALLKTKTIRGQSIGYDVFPDGMEYDGKTNVWNLTAIDLWENSIVTFNANYEATVESVKSRLAEGKLPAPSEFEDLLRDVAGFTRKQAKKILACGYSALLRDVGEQPLRDAEETDAVLFMKALSDSINTR